MCRFCPDVAVPRQECRAAFMLPSLLVSLGIFISIRVWSQVLCPSKMLLCLLLSTPGQFTWVPFKSPYKKVYGAVVTLQLRWQWKSLWPMPSRLFFAPNPFIPGSFSDTSAVSGDTSAHSLRILSLKPLQVLLRNLLRGVYITLLHSESKLRMGQRSLLSPGPF